MRSGTCPALAFLLPLPLLCLSLIENLYLRLRRFYSSFVPFVTSLPILAHHRHSTGTAPFFRVFCIFAFGSNFYLIDPIAPLFPRIS